MESFTLDSLARKTTPELVHVIRRLGADSQLGESRESLINRIWQFAPRDFKQEIKIERKPVKPLTEQELREALKVHLLAGMTLEVADGGWVIEWPGGRRDSGTCSMPASVIERCARYIKPKGVIV